MVTIQTPHKIKNETNRFAHNMVVCGLRNVRSKIVTLSLKASLVGGAT